MPRLPLAAESSLALTVGNFDGVHLGHHALLSYMKRVANRSRVLTFANHPASVLGRPSPLLLTSFSHRITLLKKQGVDEVITIPFTFAFAQQTATQFLDHLLSLSPFTHLILGHDACLGSDRQCDLSAIGKALGIKVEYIAPFIHQQQIISSSCIRAALIQGELAQVAAWLGRPFSIVGSVEHGSGAGKPIVGYPTANLVVEGLALPPFGVYAVHVCYRDRLYPAVANLGCAPTLHQGRPPLLEVHLLDQNTRLYNQTIEVIFRRFLRPERHFDSLTELQTHIRQDILAAHETFVEQNSCPHP